MQRGIRRLFSVLAALWLVVTGFVWISRPTPDRGGELLIILVGSIVIYGFGRLITFLADGFRKPRGRIIDL